MRNTLAIVAGIATALVNGAGLVASGIAGWTLVTLPPLRWEVQALVSGAAVTLLCGVSGFVGARVGEELMRFLGVPLSRKTGRGLVRNVLAYLGGTVGCAAALALAWVTGNGWLHGDFAALFWIAASPTAALLATRAVLRWGVKDDPPSVAAAAPPAPAAPAPDLPAPA